MKTHVHTWNSLRDHASIPVCATIQGCRQHVQHLSLGQRWALMSRFGIHSEDALARRIRAIRRKQDGLRRIKKRIKNQPLKRGLRLEYHC
ncbi:MAG TPA: hypothetical protein PKB02_02560 [Anaerohalosphaeraceae bacterium]|nr:hypothetical protein [Anaerohalosphaeraceae bacterium]